MPQRCLAAALAAFLVVNLAGCASTTRRASVSRTTGVQNGQPVDLTTTVHEKSETDPELPPQAAGLLGFLSSLLTGPNLAAGGGILALVVGWLRESQHSKRHQNDADEGWNEFKRLAVAEDRDSAADRASRPAPLPPLPA